MKENNESKDKEKTKGKKVKRKHDSIKKTVKENDASNGQEKQGVIKRSQKCGTRKR